MAEYHCYSRSTRSPNEWKFLPTQVRGKEPVRQTGLQYIRGLSDATITDSLKMAGDGVASKARKQKGIHNLSFQKTMQYHLCFIFFPPVKTSFDVWSAVHDEFILF